MSKFQSMQTLVAQNPLLQFAQKAIRNETVSLSDAFSPTGMSFGLGQDLGENTDAAHVSNVDRQRLFLNMMKFNMQQQGS